MRPPQFIAKSNRSGFALLVTMGFLTVSLVAYSSLMYWVTSNAKVSKRNILFNQSQAAAESATEAILATMMRDFNNQSLNSSNTYTSPTNLPSQSGWPVTFTFTDTNNVTNATTVIALGTPGWSQLPARYNGLWGWGQTWTISARAIPQNVGEDISATISQTAWFGSIPVFQYAVFYNMDLEINPGQAMNLNGRVHSNNNIYATGANSSAPLTFSDYVEAAVKYYSTPSPLDPNNIGRTGNVNFTITANNPQFPAQTLSLPVGTNNNPAAVLAILGIPPAGVVPTSPAGQSYVYNQADLIITNSSIGALAVYYQNFNSTPSQVLVPMDTTNVSGGVTNISYSFLTNATFYDYREAKTVKAVQLDVGKFNTWFTNTTGATLNARNNSGATSEGHLINGIYVYNGVPATGSQLPAVRVVNGAQLPPAGLSVATPFPIYVQGNYNITTNGTKFSTVLGDTTNTVPASLMGDAVTVLSSNWVDTATGSIALGSRNPANTTINAACLEGIVPSNGSYYSGGLENFLRLLENWSSSTTLAYNGTIVVLFPSQYATAYWGNSTYYSAPKRTWGFDVNFKQQSKLPPMTPQVRAIIRSGWATQ